MSDIKILTCFKYATQVRLRLELGIGLGWLAQSLDDIFTNKQTDRDPKPKTQA